MEKPQTLSPEDDIQNGDSSLEAAESGADFEPKDSHTELVQFSKRYSLAGRQKLAEEIREMRFQYFKKEKGNPKRQKNIAEQEKRIETLRGEKDQIEQEVESTEDEIEQKKASLWYKISSMFYKAELEEELGLDPKEKSLRM